MKVEYKWAAVAAFILLLSISPARAVEVLSSEELALHCKELSRGTDNPDAIFCIRYVQGFIDGAVATDERVTRNVSDEFEKSETFKDRAVRTRGVRRYIESRMDEYGPSVYAGFCLGEPVPLPVVVDRVAEQLADTNNVEAKPQARDLVYATLRAYFPCQAKPD